MTISSLLVLIWLSSLLGISQSYSPYRRYAYSHWRKTNRGVVAAAFIGQSSSQHQHHQQRYHSIDKQRQEQEQQPKYYPHIHHCLQRLASTNKDDDETVQEKSLSSSQSSTVEPTTPSTLTLFSPSKINLFLRIIRKRPDGYHDLASLFQAIAFGDTLELTPLISDEGNDDDDDKSPTCDEFTCNMPGVPIDSSNLVLRAINLMRNKTGLTQQYFRVNLIKQVPAQAGLGGGSANAATAMWGVNQLLGNPATLEQMVEWSADLGSDITFFLSCGTAYCTGRGEIMESINPPLSTGSTKVCIVKPTIGLSTPSVFKALNYDELSTLDADEVLLPSFLKLQQQQQTKAKGDDDDDDNNTDDSNSILTQVPKEYFVNDLEPPAFRCIPELQQLKEELSHVSGFDHVMMSGSGTSMFCLGEPTNKEEFVKQMKSYEERHNGTISIQTYYFTEFLCRSPTEWYQQPTTTTTTAT